MSTFPKLDTSVPPPSVQMPADFYQNWALQWTLYQQAQQAAYQNQLYQSFATQQKPSQPTPNPVPPPSSMNNASNNFNSLQQNNTSKWQPSSKTI